MSHPYEMNEYDDDYDDDDDDDKGGPVSSDDEQERFVRGKAPRFEYPTFGNHQQQQQQQQRPVVAAAAAAKRTRHEREKDATYGVFMTGSDDGDDDSTSGDEEEAEAEAEAEPQQRRRRDDHNNSNKKEKHRSKHKRPRWLVNGGGDSGDTSAAASAVGAGTVGDSYMAAPMFVKGASLEPTDTEQQQHQHQQQRTNPAEASIEMDVKKPAMGQNEEKNNDNDIEDEEAAAAAAAAEEQELQRQREQANLHFLSLLERAKNSKIKSQQKQPPPPPASTLASTLASHEKDHHDQMNRLEDDGLGFTAAASMSTLFSFQQGKRTSAAAAAVAPPPPRPRRDPNLGTWEKHTKGIGMKLLAKMGYTGSGGLGSKRRRELATTNQQQQQQQSTITTTSSNKDTDMNESQAPVVVAPAPTTKSKLSHGITRTVQVKVRPVNLGLGFGGFQEATKLKVNQQIEAQVRGIELPISKDDDDDDGDDNKGKKKSNNSKKNSSSMSSSSSSFVKASSLPTVQDLLKDQSWRRGGGGGGSAAASKKRQGRGSKRTVIPYTELVQQNAATNADKQVVIIDMRGPNIGSSISGGTTRNQDDAADDDDPNNKQVVVPLAEELLHNVTLLLGTYENQVYSMAQLAESSRQRLNSLQADVQDLNRRKQNIIQRQDKLQQALNVFNDLEQMTIQQELEINHNNNTNKSSRNGMTLQKRQLALAQKVSNRLQTLAESFTVQELESLQFWQVLAPTILGNVVLDSWIKNQWNPLRLQLQQSTYLIRWIMSLSTTNSSNSTATTMSSSIDEAATSTSAVFVTKNNDDNLNDAILQINLFSKYVLPRLKQILESQWDPMTETEQALLLYEEIVGILTPRKKNATSTAFDEMNDDTNEHQIFPSRMLDDVDDDDDHVDLNDGQVRRRRLVQTFKNEIIFQTIHPKLVRCLNQWKPQLEQEDLNNNNSNSNSRRLANRLDLWILPWLPHLDDHPALLPELMADCKRKVRSGLSFLLKAYSSNNNKKNNDDCDDGTLEFFTEALRVLRPWRGALKQSTLQDMVSHYVTPLLARHLSNMPRQQQQRQQQQVSSDKNPTDWRLVDSLIQFHSFSLVSDMECLSLIEGELLPAWCCSMYKFLEESSMDSATLKHATENYYAWKNRLFGDSASSPSSSTRTIGHLAQLLRHDEMICRYFYAVLSMIGTASAMTIGAGDGDGDDDDDDDNDYVSGNRQQKKKTNEDVWHHDLDPSLSTSTNYRVVLARRIKDQKRQAADDIMRMGETGVAVNNNTNIDNDDRYGTTSHHHAAAEARVRLVQQDRNHHNHGGGGGGITGTATATFRDVVQEFARNRGHLFQPRLSGSHTTVDGKQVFMFGQLPIYLDSNVVYVLRKTSSSSSELEQEWKPCSLEEVAILADAFTTRT